jgi:hypothetical protein
MSKIRIAHSIYYFADTALLLCIGMGYVSGSRVILLAAAAAAISPPISIALLWNR